MSTYIGRKAKGCKRYRSKILGKPVENIPHNMVKFSETTETVIGLDSSKFLNGIWNRSCLSNQMRTFLFKLHNNTAGYNNAVAHFVPGHSPNCTFCDIIGNQEIIDETSVF